MRHALSIASESKVLGNHPRMTFRAGVYAYEIASDGKQNSYRVTNGKETISETILYAFGNAHVAQTYVYRRNGKLYEGRVSYYAAIDGLDWTIGDVLNPPPSLEEAAGRDISGDEARNCFSCHGTAAVISTRLQLDRLIPGVTCEACHGPGGATPPSCSSHPERAWTFATPKNLMQKPFAGILRGLPSGVDTVAMMPDLGASTTSDFSRIACSTAVGTIPKMRGLLVLLATTPRGFETRGQFIRFQLHHVPCDARRGTVSGAEKLRNGQQTG